MIKSEPVIRLIPIYTFSTTSKCRSTNKSCKTVSPVGQSAIKFSS